MIATSEEMRQAACARPENRDLPWMSEDASIAERAAMARVCATCPVFVRCAVEVATTETTAGFWAGHDRTEVDLPEQGTLDLECLDAASVGVAA